MKILKNNRNRILVVDDHPLVREGLAALISTTDDLELSGEAGSAEEAMEQIGKTLPDIVMLDLVMPGMNELDFLKRVRFEYPDVKILVLSMHEESIYAERVLRVGAHGYIMKQTSGQMLLDAIRRVLRGDLYVSTTMASRILKRFAAGESRKVEKKSGVDLLSNRELQVLVKLGHGMSTQDIADQLQLSTKTIQTYREHIKRKLELRNAADLVHFATQWVHTESL